VLRYIVLELAPFIGLQRRTVLLLLPLPVLHPSSQQLLRRRRHRRRRHRRRHHHLPLPLLLLLLLLLVPQQPVLRVKHLATNRG